MTKELNRKKADLRFFQFILILLLISFFDEAESPLLSGASLLAMLFIPIAILLWFAYCPQKITKEERAVIWAFTIFMFVQAAGIRWNDLYTSITPIYRSFTLLTAVLYIRRFHLSVEKVRSISCFTLIAFLIGFATIFTPNEIGANKFYGNYNTVGALFFTLIVINLLLYLKTHNNKSILLCFCCLTMILLSNTRTAFLLVLILLFTWLFLILFKNSASHPKIIYFILTIILIGFVLFYYNIKSLSVYADLNKISQSLFHKNFDSGRPDLWNLTVKTVGNDWLLGCGTGIDLEMFYSNLKTPHSVYFDIYLQNGALGVVTFGFCIYYSIKAKGKWKTSRFNLLLIAVVFVLLFYNSVGIVFTKARSGIGLLQWALVALPYTIGSKNTAKKENINDKPNCAGLQCKTVSERIS